MIFWKINLFCATHVRKKYSATAPRVTKGAPKKMKRERGEEEKGEKIKR